MNMCTLTTQYGITWNIVNLAGHTSFIHNRLVIANSIRDGHYHLVQNGKSVYRSMSAGECLEVSSEMILDAYANGIVPSWDELEIEDELEPITERYPSNYIPNWAEAAA